MTTPHPDEVFKTPSKKTLPTITNTTTKEDNIIYTSFLSTDKYILEQINNAVLASHASHMRESQFLKYDIRSGTTCTVDYYGTEGYEFRPIVDEIYTTGTVLLPTGVEEYGNTNELVKEIKEFLFSYFQPPKFFEDFLPYLCLFYWVFEKFPFIPYLQFMGGTSTGKTTAMEVFGCICYKSIDVAGITSMASIFRVANQWGGTLLLDEFDVGLGGKEGYKAMLSFLKSGVSEKPILRTEGDKKREVKVYKVKSPKIFTSEVPISDAGLQSRTLAIQMRKNTRRLPLYRLNRFYTESQSLRNKLTLWRLRTMPVIKLEDMEFGYEALAHLDGRVQQVITPMYHLSDKRTRKKIVEFAREQEEETFRQRRESLEGRIFEFIWDNQKNIITLSMVYEQLNKGSKREISARLIGSRIRKVLGFDIEKVGHEKISTIILENREKRLKEHAEHYGLTPSRSPTACAAQSAQARDCGTLDKNAAHTKDSSGTLEEKQIQEFFDEE